MRLAVIIGTITLAGLLACQPDATGLVDLDDTSALSVAGDHRAFVSITNAGGEFTFTCRVFDGDGNLFTTNCVPVVIVVTQSHNGNVRTVVRGQVPNNAGRPVTYTQDDNPLGRHVTCRIPGPDGLVLLDKWVERISTTGQMTIRCFRP